MNMLWKIAEIGSAIILISLTKNEGMWWGPKNE